MGRYTLLTGEQWQTLQRIRQTKNSLFLNCSILKIRALCSFEMSVTTYHWMQRNIPEHFNFSSVTVTAQNFGLQPLMPITVFIYLLTPWCRVLLEKLTGLQLVKFPAFHGTRRFITALTSVRHLSLSWASPIQSIYPHPTSWRSILLLSTHLRLGLPIDLFPSGFPTKTLYSPLSSPIRTACPAHLILLDFITRTIFGEEYKSFSSSLCNLLHSPVTQYLFIWLKSKWWLFQDPSSISLMFSKTFFFVIDRWFGFDLLTF